MSRTLLIITEPRNRKGETGVTLCYGEKAEMLEIQEDHCSVKGNKAFTLPVTGPELNLKAIDVAWGVEDETLPGRDEGRGGLQKLLRDAIEFGAKNHRAILGGLPPKIRKPSPLD